MVRKKTAVGEEPGRGDKASLRPLDWLKSQLGVPAHAVFMGFGIENAEAELFLADCAPARIDNWQWSASVEEAHCFDRWAEVQEVASGLAQGRIVLLFDYGEEIWVFPAR